MTDSSTLIHLSAIERLFLLEEFFGQIIIPPAVWREVVEQGGERDGAKTVKTAAQQGWIRIVTPENDDLLQLLHSHLDDGEAEAIALAIEQEASLICLDETEARRIASSYRLPVTGVIGLLIRARRGGQIESLKPELDKLREQSGFWIEERLYMRALETVNEI